MLLVNVYVMFDRWGRMGNRMFQYAFGYILAEKRNTRLFTQGLPNFNIPNTLEVENLPPIVNPLYTIKYGNHYADLQELYITNQDVVVNSFLQKTEYYINYRNQLKEIFNIKSTPINKDKLVLHIRETDYVEINGFLGYDYYKSLIKDSGFTDVIIVTDNSNCDTVKRLISEGCTLNTAGYVDKFNHVSDDRSMQDFFTLVNSENIAISQSSFSWWAAFLGDHKNIIIPFKTNGGIWSSLPGTNDIDLFIPAPNVKKYVL